ncbi:calcium-dependent phosphotriesterase [Ophiobolus disseminans]|uniref:Calcium-dependent phosphotriesterase n=1 Tax=Ophiobolus disseminans TaxID=1469910 RepID=A0A6A6ZQ22_9PLEO|nr:calcium-dependent phosphotriesterase [Ophiobolus disseminans]
MDAQVPVIWKTIIVTAVSSIMSSIIPVDLTAFATNPSYVNNLVATNSTGPAVVSFLAYNPDFANVLGANATARLVHDAPWQAFHEAGIYSKQTNKLYVTSNWAGSLDNPINVTIIDLDPAANYSYTSTRYSTLAEGNGGTSWFPPGSSNSSHPHHLYADEGDFVNPSALVSVDPVTGESKRILTHFLGRNFSSINDVRQHPETGDIWFTDADYGYYQYFRPAPKIPKQVYRFVPSTGEIVVVADGFTQSNGIEFSPDLKTLYVSDTGAAGGPFLGTNYTRPTTIYAFDIVKQKRLANRRVFAFTDNGFPDGIHTDTDGNVWVGQGDGIHVWNEDGILLGKVWSGLETNNFAFLPGKILMFGMEQLHVVENVKAVGREICKDFSVC